MLHPLSIIMIIIALGFLFILAEPSEIRQPVDYSDGGLILPGLCCTCLGLMSIIILIGFVNM